MFTVCQVVAGVCLAPEQEARGLLLRPGRKYPALQRRSIRVWRILSLAERRIVGGMRRRVQGPVDAMGKEEGGKPPQRACLKRLSPMYIMNADDHERRGRRDVHDRVFLNWQREHVRENGHARARGYGQSQSRGHAGGCAGADVRESCS